jgi:ABC-type sugar transport system ATPase subunit
MAFLSLRGISKEFPGVKALTGVDLDLVAGRGHALVGENGAGKSTLIKVMAGIVRPDEGSILVEGEEVQLRSPAEARQRGISLVPQELSLVGGLSVAENIFMGQLPRSGPRVDRGALRRNAEAALERLGIGIHPFSRLGTHPPAVQQLVMIARGIALRGRLFILDEPTAALADREIERLFAVITELKAGGAGVVYVSHRLEELEHVADEVTVLRDGRVVDRALTAETSEDALVRSMIGRPVERYFDTRSSHDVEPEVVLRASGLSRKGAFEDVTFSVHGGEVVGLGGLMGAGRTEVARALFGVDRLDAGEVEVKGEQVKIRSPRDAIDAGLALVPEERKAQGLIPDRSISDNLVLPHLRELATGVFLRERRLRQYSDKIKKAVNVRARSVTAAVRTLSGGNQQKVVLGRWLTGKPAVYVLDEPTRGIDIQAKTEIYQQIGALAERGAGVLVISSELPELLGISDRILVMRAGRLVGEVDAAGATEESVLQLAMGTNA